MFRWCCVYGLLFDVSGIPAHTKLVYRFSLPPHLQHVLAKQPFWVLSTTPFGYADCMGTITSTLTVASLTVSSLTVFGYANVMGTPDFLHALACLVIGSAQTGYEHILGSRLLGTQPLWVRRQYEARTQLCKEL